MAHFAEIDNDNVVVRVLVVPDDQEERGQDFLAIDLGLGGTWKKTSYNTVGGEHLLGGTPYRYNYAGIGYTYDADKDGFIPPKPFASWKLSNVSLQWLPPVAMPTDGKIYIWDEETTNWVESPANPV